MKLIAETAWHHEGDPVFLHALVDALMARRAHSALKFHLSIDFDAYMAADHPAYGVLKEWLLDRAQWSEVLEKAARGGDLLLLYNDCAAVEFGQQFQPSLVEVHACNLNNIHLLDGLKRNLEPGQKVVLGVGGNELEDIDRAVERLGWDAMVLMFGFQNYPTRLENINFRKIQRVMARYPSFVFGYADHCAWNEPDNLLVTVMGAALGMDYVEKHVTLEPGVERCDWQSCISLDQLAELRRMLDVLEGCRGDGSLALSPAEQEYSKMGVMKALAVTTRPLKAGDRLTEQDFRFIRCGRETDLRQRDLVGRIGNLVLTDLPVGSVIRREHIEE